MDKTQFKEASYKAFTKYQHLLKLQAFDIKFEFDYDYDDDFVYLSFTEKVKDILGGTIFLHHTNIVAYL